MASLLKSEENASIVGDGGEVLLERFYRKRDAAGEMGNGQEQKPPVGRII